MFFHLELSVVFADERFQFEIPGQSVLCSQEEIKEITWKRLRNRKKKKTHPNTLGSSMHPGRVDGRSAEC